MKRITTIFAAIAALFALGFTSCSDDDLGASIYDTDPSIDYLDKSSSTFPLDSFLKVSFLEPYNLRFIYKMQDISSDMQKNLVPADYDKSCKLAVLSKYLWYDVYAKLAPNDFLPLYSPRIIHVIGSPSYNPSTGTETLGSAEGGLKITLYNVNSLDESNIALLNSLFFHTMHHEFGHILDQTHQRPTSFNTISNGLYDPSNWGSAYDSISCSKGFVTNYASSQAREDWVEVMASYICDDSITWAQRLEHASYDWEEVKVSSSAQDSIRNLIRSGANRDSVGYFRQLDNGDYVIDRKVIARNANGTAALDEEGNIQYLSSDNIDGKAVILEKLDLVREWLSKYFEVDIDALREEVQNRSYVKNADGTFKKDSWGNFVNKLTAPAEDDASRTLMDELMDWINQYKALQQ
ncbi:MAG: substrate import-associated zinc metallohydrolase lipoprotein [Prevotella sp.]|jgi:substrate import-associated zinc metallohydrolase lipoprotein